MRDKRVSFAASVRVEKHRSPFCEPLGSFSSFCASSILSGRQEESVGSEPRAGAAYPTTHLDGAASHESSSSSPDESVRGRALATTRALTDTHSSSNGARSTHTQPAVGFPQHHPAPREGRSCVFCSRTLMKDVLASKMSCWEQTGEGAWATRKSADYVPACMCATVVTPVCISSGCSVEPRHRPQIT